MGAWNAFAAEQSPDIPAWLAAHIGDGRGQIASPVLQRARTLYLQKVSAGRVRNPCYFAMDATRPNDSPGRFYIVCEAQHAFRVISAGHGSGRDLDGAANFSNERECAKNFGNAMDSDLTMGGAYVTDAAKTSFKGYYRVAANQDAALMRTFIPFDGEGETANARERAIGGHAAVTLKNVCLKRELNSPYADRDGYVRFGQVVEYTGGRSDGCTSWSQSDIQQILALVTGDPTTLYIYPSAADINAVAQAVAAGQSPVRAGLYWNSYCLSKIHAPRFWSSQSLEPIIARYKREHPAPPPQPTPICPGQ
ncbi:murein L,D-transpeptidase catalytic domain family protein [Methylovirgula sp. 4M-Z18]|uniref:murein L,D-transpeptidase catalytic domain family protein n=1 Tax=Methylovirgula sp. 4M-Z18 TaxID=2293567 RepID=UPI001FE0CD31|nr:murein L,D-transpeptidase catalytic domain family protein [Methylovirgula sp. 4M-Z18]